MASLDECANQPGSVPPDALGAKRQGIQFRTQHGHTLPGHPRYRSLDSSGESRSANIYRDYGSSVMYDDGKVLVMGGGDPPTNTAEVIDLNAPKPAWRSVASMAFVRRHTQRYAPAGREGTSDRRY